MVEIGAVAVPNDGIVVVLHTVPLTFPSTVELAILACVEPWVNEVTEGNRVVHDIIFTAEGRVVMRQSRCDA